MKTQFTLHLLATNLFDHSILGITMRRVLLVTALLLGFDSPAWADLISGAKGYVFRVQAGPFTKINNPRALCSELKSREVDCWVK